MTGLIGMVMELGENGGGYNVRAVRLRGKPQMGWLDSLKRALNGRGKSVEQGRMIVCDRSEWKAVVNAWALMWP